MRLLAGPKSLQLPAKMLRDAALVCCISWVWLPATASEFIDKWVRSFAESEIAFARSTSNAPFVPLVFTDLSLYSDTRVRSPDGSTVDYDFTSFSLGGLLPFLVSPRDALGVGGWVATSRFDARDADEDSFSTLSVGMPVGWLRQLGDRRQAVAFVMPLAHRADLDDSQWSYQTLGGLFGRVERDERLWWVYGFYFDVGAGDEIYLPYLGASWEIDDEIIVNAILPWPAILYAPDRDTLWRFGASPSGASWTLDSDQNEVAYKIDNWKLGVAFERRMSGNFWLSIQAGVAGLRSLRLQQGEWEGFDFDVDTSTYVSIGVNFRPGSRP